MQILCEFQGLCYSTCQNKSPFAAGNAFNAALSTCFVRTDLGWFVAVLSSGPGVVVVRLTAKFTRFSQQFPFQAQSLSAVMRP